MTPMRIAVIGNSHAACFRNAVAETTDERIAFVFFAARGKKLRALEAHGGILRAGAADVADAIRFTSGGLDQIEPSSFDGFLVIGSGLKVRSDFDQFHSIAVLRQVALEIARRSTNWRLCRLVRSVTDKPVWVFHDPMPASEHSLVSRALPGTYLNLLGSLQSFYDSTCQAELIAQPQETLSGESFTSPTFSVDSVRLSVGSTNDNEQHPESDMFHMNAAFGEHLVQAFRARVARARTAATVSR